MPPKQPVPSKGALRALRTLALGTTCTVAFATGALVEERRRRIHTLQKMCDNARKIKACKQYRASGAAEALEALLLRQEERFPSATPISTDPAPAVPSNVWMMENSDDTSWHTDAQSPQLRPGGHGAIRVNSLFLPARLPADSYQAPRHKHVGLEEPKAEPQPPTESYLQRESTSTPSCTNRQHQLALDVLKLLNDKAAPDAATTRFFEAFDDSLPIEDSGVSQELINAAVQLSKVCLTNKDFDNAERILQTILTHGNIDPDIYLAFNPEAIMRGLISEERSQESDSFALYKAGLRKACALYLLKFERMPETIPKGLLDLGTTLCNKASQYGLFDLVEGLYWRIGRYNQDTPLPLVKHLIIATVKEKQHTKSVKYFKRFYVRTSPDQLQFYTVLGLVLDGLLESDRHHLCEDILTSAAGMAEREGIFMSSTWILKVLGNNWRARRNIAGTRALFHRLQPHFHLVQHPGAIYSAMIQFCIEAGDEQTAAAYYEELTTLHDVEAVKLRIYGHFTLAKAMRNDWAGVRDGLDNMRKLNPDAKELSDSFTPIMKLFAQSHDLAETEDFLRSFIQIYGGHLTPYLSNIMISKYLKAGELDSVARWLDYMATVNCKVDPSFFNSVLGNCFHKFGLSYEQVHQIYLSVAKLHSRANRFINRDSLSTLRALAISSAGPDVGKAVHRLRALRLQVPMRANSSHGVQSAMMVALEHGNPDRALKLFQRALDDEIPLSEAIITLGLRATLKVYPDDMDAAIRFLQSSQQAGHSVENATSLLFVYLMSGIGDNDQANSDTVKDIAQSTISSLERGGVVLPLTVIASTMNTLATKAYYREAINFWEAMSQREGYPPIPINIRFLTTILRAYVGLNSPEGVEWVIETLRSCKISPDRHFQHILRNSLNWANKLDTPHLTHALVQALEIVRELRMDVIKDKNEAQMKLFEIMESAIQTEATGYAETPAPWEPKGNEPRLPSPKIHIASESPGYNIDQMSPASLVGIMAG